MANSDKNILITPSVGLSTSPTIKFNGANNTPTTLRVLDDGTVSFEGTAGQLFSISDGLTGSIFSVNDISGIPSIEVLDTGLVKLNQYGGSTVFGTSAAIQNGSSVNAKVSISTASATTPGLIIKSVASQSANLQEWQNSAGSILASLNQYGTFTTIGNLTVSTYTALGSSTRGTEKLFVLSTSASEPAAVFKAAASQTADLQQWQNSSGTVLAKVDAYGTLLSNWKAYIQSGASYLTPMIIVGASGQTANLQEWQNYTGTALSYIDTYGIYRGPGYAASANLAVGWYTIAVNDGSRASARFVIGETAGSRHSYAVIQASHHYGNGNNITLLHASAYGTMVPSQYRIRYGVWNGGAMLQVYVSDATNTLYHKIFENEGVNGWKIVGWVPDGTAPGGTGSTPNGVFTDLNLTTTPIDATRFWNSSYGWVGNQLALNGGIFASSAVIKGNSAQTANLQEWQNSSGTVENAIIPGKGLLFNLGNDATGSQNLTQIAFGFSPVSSSTGNWKHWVITKHNNVTSVNNAIEFYTNDGTQSGVYPTNAIFGLSVTNGGIITPKENINIASASTVGLTVKAAASQTANLQEWQNSSGTVLTRIDQNGNIYFAARVFAGGWYAGDYNLFSRANAGNEVATVVRGNTSQTADLQQWQNSAGTVLSSITSNGFLNTPAILENPTISATAATGTINYDLLTNKSVTYYTSNASANWTLNIRGNSSTTLDSLMAVGQSLTIAFLVTQGSTAYYQSGLQIDGTSVTPKWQGGVAPTFGNASGVDSYSITIMKTASATFTVFESQTRFA